MKANIQIINLTKIAFWALENILEKNYNPKVTLLTNTTTATNNEWKHLFITKPYHTNTNLYHTNKMYTRLYKQLK